MNGLAKCCVQRIDDYMRTLPTGLAAPGDTLTCTGCQGRLVFVRGAWQWEPPKGAA
jgi:hypothetical protein